MIALKFAFAISFVYVIFCVWVYFKSDDNDKHNLT